MLEKLTNQELDFLREKHGDNSLVGRLCKTIASQIRKLSDHVTPAWATHESQTLQGKIRW